MNRTGIEWTDRVWNPTTGCDRISPGCDNCYALTMAKRLKGMGQAKYQNDGDPRTSGPGFGVAVHPDALDINSGVEERPGKKDCAKIIRIMEIIKKQKNENEIPIIFTSRKNS